MNDLPAPRVAWTSPHFRIVETWSIGLTHAGLGRTPTYTLEALSYDAMGGERWMRVGVDIHNLPDGFTTYDFLFEIACTGRQWREGESAP